MRDLFIWHSTDMDVSFARFRDTVVAQTAMVLMHRGSGKGFNALGEQPHKERAHEHQECESCEGDYTSEEIAA